MAKWFVSSNDFIKGPFSTEEVKAQMADFSDQMYTTFLWSRGYAEWIRADKWNPDVNIPPNPQVQNTTTQKSEEVMFTPQAKNIFEKQSARASKAEVIENIKSAAVEKFRVQYDFVDKGEMTKDELMSFTSRQEDVSKISIFDKKDREWKEIYSIPDIVQRLGITRRKNQRVPILAQFTGTHLANGEKINARVITISQGGIGITDNFNLKLGETIQGQLVSPHFYSPVNMTAEVTYAGLDGYVGLKFVNINDEMMALVLDYVKRFGKDANDQ